MMKQKTEPRAKNSEQELEAKLEQLEQNKQPRTKTRTQLEARSWNLQQKPRPGKNNKEQRVQNLEQNQSQNV